MSESTHRRALRWANDRAPAPVRRLVGRTLRRVRGRLSRGTWEAGASHELDHWRELFATQPGRIGWLTNPDAAVPEGSPLYHVLDELGDGPRRVLDLGAGPITPNGHVFRGHRLDVVAVDVLAPSYNELLDELGIEPPVRTIAGEGERLADLFPAGSFDVACAINALDHCYDPIVVIEQMLMVVRTGGRVLLEHMRNEGERRLYRGMHQWNLDERDGDLRVWNPSVDTSASELFRDRASVRAEARAGRVIAVLTPT